MACDLLYIFRHFCGFHFQIVEKMWSNRCRRNSVNCLHSSYRWVSIFCLIIFECAHLFDMVVEAMGAAILQTTAA